MTLSTDKFLLCAAPDISGAEEQSVLHVLRSGWLGYGSVAKSLEDEFADFLGIENAVALNSCTMGLYLALKVSGAGAGDEVITTPLTFAATVNAILATGANPVFVDVDETGCINPHLIEKAITKQTKAIVPVHLWGVPCDMDLINLVAKHVFQGITVIEDAAHGFGGNFEGNPLGTLGDFGVFSLYPTKNIASADGGILVTRSEEKAEKVRLLASQGLSSGAWKRHSKEPVQNYEVSEVGFKGLMPDVLAAIGLAQLRRWDDLKEKRNKIFKIYEKTFGKGCEGHSQHIYQFHVEHRDDFRRGLYKEGIGTGVHYNPLHLEPAYKFLGYKKGNFPIAEEIGRKTVSLPLSTTMTEEDAYRVVEVVTEKLRENK